MIHLTYSGSFTSEDDSLIQAIQLLVALQQKRYRNPVGRQTLFQRTCQAYIPQKADTFNCLYNENEKLFIKNKEYIQ